MLYKDLEHQPEGFSISTEQAIRELKYDKDGLIPAIAQQHDSGEVLMMAWMNQDSIQESLRTGRVCYWSRSRQCFWRKGESSGHIQKLIALYADCDGDTLLLKVDQQGPACHTLRRDCFYIKIDAEQASIISDHG